MMLKIDDDAPAQSAAALREAVNVNAVQTAMIWARIAATFQVIWKFSA